MSRYLRTLAPMRFAVVATRHRGVLIPRPRIATAVAVIGDLHITEERDDVLGRNVPRAVLVGTCGDALTPRLLPPLNDPRLLWMGPLGMTLAGIERLDGVEFAQTWWCRQP